MEKKDPKQGQNRFSDRLNKPNRMASYAEDTDVAAGMVSITPVVDEKKEEPQKIEFKVEEKDEIKANDRLMAFVDSKTKKIACSITLSADVLGAVDKIVDELKSQKHKTNRSIAVDELLREALMDLGYLTK